MFFINEWNELFIISATRMHIWRDRAINSGFALVENCIDPSRRLVI